MLVLFTQFCAFLLAINICAAATLSDDRKKAQNVSDYLKKFDDDLNSAEKLNHIGSDFDDANNQGDDLDAGPKLTNLSSAKRRRLLDLEQSIDVGLQILKNVQLNIEKLNANVELIKIGLINMSILPTGRYYYHQGEMVKWTEAKKFCKERSLKLAVMNSKFEAEALFDAAPHLRDAFWLDATDIGHEPGEFFWSDGRDVDRRLWDRENGQPNDFATGNQTAVCLSHLHRGRLCDGNIALHKAYFICES